MRIRILVPFLCRGLVAMVAFACILSSACLPLAAQDFKGLPPAEELSLKEIPAAPGAQAAILQWNLDVDDPASQEVEYYRIKIFTDQGKSHGDVQISYRDTINISDIKARTIQPDGTIVPFTGKIFEKILVKGRGYQLKAKTFTFPDVRPGSILEYRYKRSWDIRALPPTHWDLQKKLFIRKATLTLKPYLEGGYAVTYISMLAPGTKKPEDKKGKFILDLENVPAFEEEEFSLPEPQIMPHIDFFYRGESYKDTDEFWTKYGKEMYGFSQDFIGNRGGIRQAAAALVASTHDNETKLRKLYARVQQIRNLTYEESKTAKEQSRVTPKTNNNVEDVLKNGYGYRNQITRLFVALARAAGIEANVVRVSQRDAQVFQKAMWDEGQLDGEIAVAMGNGGKELLLDPATPYCPFGLLSWENTGVDALRLDKTGGTFFRTPNPLSSQAIMRRAGEFKMDEEGALTGSVMVEYDGQEALRQRLDAMETDEIEQKKDYEKDVERWLPQGSKAKLVKIENATDGNKPLHLEYEVTVPSITSSVGSRTLLPVFVFQSRNSNPFEFAKRQRPVYFRYPWQEIENVRITLPDGMKVESLPKGIVLQPEFGYYDTKWEQIGNVISATRRRAIGGFLFHQANYPALRDFYSKVNSSDRENLVLRQGQ